MKRTAIGILIGVALCAPQAFALRIAHPIEFHEWNTNTFSQLNDVLLQIFNVINGRYAMNVVTADPDGSLPCSVGEQVLFDTGTDQLCICVTAATKVWKCVNIT